MPQLPHLNRRHLIAALQIQNLARLGRTVRQVGTPLQQAGDRHRSRRSRRCRDGGVGRLERHPTAIDDHGPPVLHGLVDASPTEVCCRCSQIGRRSRCETNASLSASIVL